MSITTDLQALYVTYFGRPADANGLSVWTSQVLAGNVSLTVVAEAFASSSEFTNNFAGQNSEGVVTQIYQNLFGRPPEPGAVPYWGQLLDSKVFSIAEIVRAIVNGAGPTDKTVLDNKVQAATSFTNSLTTAEQIIGYSGAAAANVAKTFLSSVTDAASLATATTSANLQKVSQDMIDAGVTFPSVIFTLTAGIDTFAPSSSTTLKGNDTFNAFSVGGSQTLSNFDSLDGGSGTDQLIIVSSTGSPVTLGASISVKNIEDIIFKADSSATIDISGWTGVATWTTSMGASTPLNLTANNVSGTITLGSGNDTLVYTGTTAPTATLDGGAGTDTLSLAASTAAVLTTANANQFKNFERLVLTGAAAQTVDLATLGGAAAGIATVAASGGTGLVLSNFAAGNTLQLSGAGTAYTLNNPTFATGSNDSVKLLLSDGSGAAVNFASTGITATGVETINITTQDNQTKATGSFNDAITLLGNSVKAITVAGNAGLSIKAASSSLASLDASAMTLGGVTLVGGSTPITLNVKGSTAGTNTVDVSASFSNTTLGGSSVTVDNANYVIKGGLGSDTITVGTGMNSVTLGTSGLDRVNVQVTANVNTYTTITDARAAMSLGFADKGSETFMKTMVVVANSGGGGYVVGGGTTPAAGFADYVNAVIAAAGNASANGVFGWTQYNGDTYLVESRHNGVATPTFVNGTDLIVKFTGLVDLGKLNLDANSNVLAMTY